MSARADDDGDPWQGTALPSPQAWPREHVQVFALDLGVDPTSLAAFESVLAKDEKAHADRYRFPRHRRRYVAGRAQLRAILAAYLGVTPQGVAFDYEEHGRPRLAGKHDIHFNLSRSEDLAVAALAAGAEIGIDVEHVRALPEAAAIVERFFSTEERRAFDALSAEAVEGAFYRCWTRKEALVKSVGLGLSHPLHTFTIGPHDAPIAEPVTLETEAGPRVRWVRDVPAPEPGVLIAIAAAGAPRAIRVARWTTSVS